MSVSKRLLVRASNEYSENLAVIPINTGEFVEIKSDIGTILISIFVRDFDGSQPHKSNSLRNAGDKIFLNGGPSNIEGQYLTDNLPNLRILIKFTPATPIKGSELLFGNDCTNSIKDYVPTTLLATGLKFFSWFINPTIRGDIYCDSPFLYAPALNSFSRIGIIKEKCNAIDSIINGSNENLSSSLASSSIPTNSSQRIKHFSKLLNCEEFSFQRGTEYLFAFDTNYLRMGDSKYHVAIPTFGDRTFDINVLKYANDQLNNFNWILKSGGIDGVKEGTLGVVINFALVDEE